MITAKMELITPAIAEEMLKHNTKNYRKLMQSKVDMYAKDMIEGRWAENGETIQFSEDGTLLNGQHRLHAIIESGASIWVLVVRGIKDGVAYIDIGASRTLSQVASANGIKDKYVNQVLGMITTILSGCMNKVYVSKPSVMKYYEDNKEELTYIASCASGVMRKSGVLVAAYVKYRHGTPLTTLQQFFAIANSGYPIDGVESTPALCLRNIVMTCAGVGGYAKRKELISCTLQAISDFEAGRRRTKRYTTSDKTLQEFYLFIKQEGFSGDQQYIREAI